MTHLNMLSLLFQQKFCGYKEMALIRKQFIILFLDYFSTWTPEFYVQCFTV